MKHLLRTQNHQHMLLEGNPESGGTASSPNPDQSQNPTTPEIDLPRQQDPQAAASSTDSKDNAETKQAAPSPDPANQIRIGDKVFNSEEEAFAYVDQLDQQQQQQPTQQPIQVVPVSELQQFQQQNASGTQKNEISEEDLKEQFYEDPVGFMQRHTEAVIKRARESWQTEEQSQRQIEQGYNFLFTRHPDLKNKRDIVDLVINQKVSQLRKLGTYEERADAIALGVRQKLKSYGLPMTTGKQLEQTQEYSGPSGGGKPDAKPAEEKILSWDEQVRKHQRRMGY